MTNTFADLRCTTCDQPILRLFTNDDHPLRADSAQWYECAAGHRTSKHSSQGEYLSDRASTSRTAA